MEFPEDVEHPALFSSSLMRNSCRAPSNNDRSGFRSQINDTSAVSIMLEVSSWAIYHWQILRWRQVDHSHSWQETPLIQWGEIHADTQKRTGNHASGYSANFHKLNMLTCALCAREQCDSHVLCLLPEAPWSVRLSDAPNLRGSHWLKASWHSPTPPQQTQPMAALAG